MTYLITFLIFRLLYTVHIKYPLYHVIAIFQFVSSFCHDGP